MIRALAVMIALTCLTATAAGAQQLADLAPGTRVRLTIADSVRQAPYLPRVRSAIGAVSRATADTLWMHFGGPDTVRISRATVRTSDVSRGVSRPRSAVEQGLAVVAIFGWPLYASADDRGERRKAIAIVGGTAVLAAIIGAARPYERWRRVR